MQVELRVNEADTGTGDKKAIPEWLDEDFLQLCMQSGEGDPTIRVLNYEVSLFRQPKKDHGTTMYRVSVEFKRRPRSRNILDFKPQEVRWLIIKTIIDHANDSEEGVRKSLIFDKEITTLSNTLPSMSKLLGLFPLSAQCFYSDKSPRSLVVMEDLTKGDFRQGKMERVKGLDVHHCLIVLQSMAAFHASSVALYEKNKSSMDPYDYNIWTGEGSELLVKNIIETAVEDVADEVSTWPNFGEKYAERIRALKNTLDKRVNEAVARDQSGFNVLNHGHCWYNNLLFRYNNATGKAKEVLFVDFQNSVFASPVIDLQHFLYSTPTDEVRLQNFNRLIQHYHRELVANFEKLKIKTKPPTKEELVKEMDERGAYSVLVAFTLLPIVVNENTTNTNILNDLSCKVDKSKMYANEQFKSSIKRLLQIFDSKGYLD